MDLMDLHETFHLKAEEYTFSSSAHGALPMIVYLLDHKKVSVNFRRFKKLTFFWPQCYETRKQTHGG